MRELTDKDFALVNETVMPIVERYVLEDTEPGLYNPFLFALTVPVKNGEDKTIKCANEIFHTLGILPKDRTLAMAEAGDYCAIFTDEGGETYTLLFNHPVAMAFKSGDEEYEFTIKGRNEIEEAEAEAEEAEMRSLVEGIKVGRLKSKTPDGYLVLAGEFYDAIEAGKKTVEYRDFTEYNIKRTIGPRQFASTVAMARKASRQSRCSGRSKASFSWTATKTNATRTTCRRISGP